MPLPNPILHLSKHYMLISTYSLSTFYKLFCILYTKSYSVNLNHYVNKSQILEVNTVVSHSNRKFWLYHKVQRCHSGKDTEANFGTRNAFLSAKTEPTNKQIKYTLKQIKFGYFCK